MAKEKKESKLKKFFGEFKKFITRGNVLDMAVGVIVGGAFTGIVNGLSNYILKPLINWLLAIVLGKEGLTGAVTFLPNCKVYKDVLDANGTVVGSEIDLANSIYIDWGAFISAVINFFIIAFVLFTIVKMFNRIAEARDRLEKGLESSEKKAIRRIRREKNVSKKEAKVLWAQEIAAAEAKKAEEERLAAEAAAEAAAKAAAEAEAKAMANTRLLEEIRDLLKQK